MNREKQISIAACECTKMGDWHGRRYFTMGANWADGNMQWNDIYTSIMPPFITKDEDTESLLLDINKPVRMLCKIYLQYNDGFAIVYECCDYFPCDGWRVVVDKDFVEKNLVQTTHPINEWHMSAEGYMTLKYGCEYATVVSCAMIGNCAKPWKVQQLVSKENDKEKEIDSKRKMASVQKELESTHATKRVRQNTIS